MSVLVFRAQNAAVASCWTPEGKDAAMRASVRDAAGRIQRGEAARDLELALLQVTAMLAYAMDAAEAREAVEASIDLALARGERRSPGVAA
jgi:hypothetical protein